MKRLRLHFLQNWLTSFNRKPLVIRGARQVGKTWLVHHFAKLENLDLIEVNLEKDPHLISLFNTNDVHKIVLNLNAAFNISIDPQKHLLFLDEIQAAPDLLAKLRWFKEDLPELPVIAAGSLLEFVLDEHSFSMPVGRISYLHLEPLSFEEFLMANDNQALLNYLKEYQWDQEIPKTIHDQLNGLFKEYVIIGGMPAAVSTWIKSRSFAEVNQVHSDLLATYRDDIGKYRGRVAKERLEELMFAIPKFLGEKFVYSKVNPDIQTYAIKQALDLLCKARVCHRVIGCAANGVPLAAKLQEKYLKMIFLDVGLSSAALGLSLEQLYLAEHLILNNIGGISEQVVGQTLRTISAPYAEPELFYWHRDEKGSSAEVDYVIQHRTKVIPIEVKSGSTGSLKSLHLFMGLKRLSLAVRVNSDIPSKVKVTTKDRQGNSIEYTLTSLPFYLLEQTHRLIDSA